MTVAVEDPSFIAVNLKFTAQKISGESARIRELKGIFTDAVVQLLRSHDLDRSLDNLTNSQSFIARGLAETDIIRMLLPVVVNTFRLPTECTAGLFQLLHDKKHSSEFSKILAHELNSEADGKPVWRFEQSPESRQMGEEYQRLGSGVANYLAELIPNIATESMLKCLGDRTPPKP